MRSRKLLMIAGAVWSGVLGCDRGSQSSTDRDAAHDVRPESVAPTTPKSPRLSARDIADLILAGGIEIDDKSFSIRSPLRCLKPDVSEDWSLFCRVVFSDAQRRGENAMVDFRIFDDDVRFADQNESVRAHVDSIDHEYLVNTSPVLQFTSKAGVPRIVETACHQSLGRVNSPAYCTLMVNSRVLIVAGVRPRRRSTMSLKLGGDEDPSNQDIRRASDLSALAALKVSNLLFPNN